MHASSYKNFITFRIKKFYCFTDICHNPTIWIAVTPCLSAFKIWQKQNLIMHKFQIFFIILYLLSYTCYVMAIIKKQFFSFNILQVIWQHPCPFTHLFQICALLRDFNDIGSCPKSSLYNTVIALISDRRDLMVPGKSTYESIRHVCTKEFACTYS